jgi:hypothetical protein
MSTSVEDKHAIYENKTLEDRQIRLLTILRKENGESDDSPIRCKLKTINLDEKLVRYTALSYTWGNHAETVTIKVEGKDFQATRSLNLALKHFRDTQDPLPDLWVDAICINQDHPDEKEAQVGFMQNIFSKAEETWAWLGSEADESGKAVALVNVLAHIYRNSCQGGSTDPQNANKTKWGSLISSELENHVVALGHLLSREYWYRVWIVQEIASSKKLVFFCGCRKFSWDPLLFAAYFLNFHDETSIIHNSRHKGDPLRGVLGGISRILAIQSVRHDFQHENMNKELMDSLLSLLSNHRSTRATQPKDKFIALAGLAKSNAEGNSTDHSKEAENVLNELATNRLYNKRTEVGDVFTQACHILTEDKRHKPLDFLDSAGLPRNYPMPSWVPDWSVVTQIRPVPLLYWQIATKKNPHLVLINAPGEAKPHTGTASSIEQNKMLHAKGRKFGSIQTLFSLPSSQKPLNTDPTDQPSYSRSKYGIDDPLRALSDVLWKTLVLNRALIDGLEAPEIWGDIFYHYISHPPNPSQPSDLQQWWMQRKHFKLWGSTLEEIALSRKPSLPVQSFDTEKELARFKSAFTIGVGYRKLATTENGYLCLVPLDAEVEDIVVILVDCSAPVLLRQRGNKEGEYVFIGTCYVHGIMHGEAVEKLEADDPFPDDFIIF